MDMETFEYIIERVKKLENTIERWTKSAPLTDEDGRPNIVRTILDLENRIEVLEGKK